MSTLRQHRSRTSFLVLVCLTLVGTLPVALRAQVASNEGRLCEDVTTTGKAVVARPLVQAQIDGKPARAVSAFLKGCLAVADDHSDKAADFFEEATKLEPGRALYFSWLGRAYGDQAEHANKLRQPFLARKTKAAFEKAVQLDPDDLDARNYLVQYYQMAPGFLGGSEDKATEQAEAIRARNAYRGGLVMANVKTRRKDLAGAEQEMRGLIKSHPDSTAPWYLLVQMQANAKAWPDAFRTAAEFRSAHPKAAAPDYMMGRLAALSGQQLEVGEAALRRYLTEVPAAGDPPFANAHWRLGQVLQQRGQTSAARAELQEAVRLAPNPKEGRAALAALK